MLDPKLYEPESQGAITSALAKRGLNAVELVAPIARLAQSRRELIQTVEALKTERNSASQEIGALKARIKKEPTQAQELERIAESKMAHTRALGDTIKEKDVALAEIQLALDALALRIPNLPHSSVPEGKDAESNQEIKRWGITRKFDFEPRDHVTLGERLGILDFERAGRISGARFAIYHGAGATLERALIQFMLDLHTREHGYQETIPPFLVSRQAAIGTGNLPKFEDDLFRTQVGERELFLIPTAEVSLTNIPREEVLEPGVLPLRLTAYSPCFRSEAGSYGRDVRGLIRQHQFQKVELVKIVAPEASEQEHEAMVADAERVLERLGIPYRRMLLCGGDMGFASGKTYDLEAWLPSGGGQYREISSCSNCFDFQARRAQIRFRSEAQAKPQFAHTLNGSGLAVGRTWIAIVENFQTADGRIEIPQALHRYVVGSPGFVSEGERVFLVGGSSRLKVSSTKS